MRRSTIRDDILITGKGLHSGNETTMRLSPAPIGTGIVFRAINGHEDNIKLSPFNVVSTVNSVTVSNGKWNVRTIEHLLCALIVAGVSDVYIENETEELPIMDGSAMPFYSQIIAVGREKFDEEFTPVTIDEPIQLIKGNKFIVALPNDQLSILYDIDFDHPELQSKTIFMSFRKQQDLVDDLLPARTFGFLRDYRKLKERGMVEGASTENTLVLTDSDYLNDPRLPDECVRHKVLDLLGDLFTIGRPLNAYIIASKCGHLMHTEMAKAIYERCRNKSK